MSKAKLKKADYYNDPGHNYQAYWQGRDYENAAEELAIKRLLAGKRFKKAVDIGGGYGRLCLLLSQFADKVILAEPSTQQLQLAKKFLAGHSRIEALQMQADDLKFANQTFDLVTLIRVIHHIPDPSAEFSEIARVLNDDGWFILEFANYAHGRNRIKFFLNGKVLPIEPVDIRSAGNRHKDDIPFVNHNPKTIIKQLAHEGLVVEKRLSVSNLRSPAIKKILKVNAMLGFEKLLQPLLAASYFGPSVFFLVRKVKH